MPKQAPAPAPFLAILDEYGHHCSPGFAAIFQSSRSLGFVDPQAARINAQKEADEIKQAIAQADERLPPGESKRV